MLIEQNQITVNGVVGTPLTSADITVDANGNVGIGTTTPSTTAGGYNGGTLHVHNTGTGSSIRLTNSTTGTSGEVGMLISKWSDSKTYFTNFDDGADIVFTSTDSGGNLVANTFVIKGDGKIGFGTSSPSARIEVASTTATNTTSVAAIDGGSISTDGDTVTGRLFWKGTGAGTDLYGVQNEVNGLTIYNYTDNQYRIYFKNDGNTGIGTNVPNGKLDVEWSANAPTGGIYLKNTNTGDGAYTGTYYGNTASDTDAFVGLVGANNPSYAGARSFLLGTNSSGGVATMVGGTQVHTVAQNSASADGYGLTTPALAQTNQLYNMSGTIVFDTINNNGLYQPMDYANAIKRYADIGSPTFRGSASTYHNSHSGSVFNSTWCANKELFDMRMGVHFWRVPKSGTYTLTARGAGYTNNGGNGISLTMDYVLYAGEWLRVVCGAQGESNYSNHMGGCGATAFSVYRQGMHIPVLVAGGGAGITPNAPSAHVRRNAKAPSTYGNHTPYVGGHYGARDGIGGHGSIYQHDYGSYINNWGGGGGGGWATPGAHGGIGINMQEQASGGAALSADCPHGGYFQNGNAYHGGFGGGGGSGIDSGASGGGGGWYGGNSTYAVNGTTADDTDYQGGGSYAAGSFTDNGAHQSYGQALIQI